MERLNTITNDFFKGIPDCEPTPVEKKITIEWADFSCMISEALVVLDFQKRNILYVSPHYLCLCGYTPEKIKEEGYDFFKFAIHPDDLPLWKDIHIVILKSLYNKKLPIDRINYFGCTLRIRNFLSDDDENPDYLMVYLKIKPKMQHDIPRLGICLLSIAVVPYPGNLSVFYNNYDYAIYSFTTGHWKLHFFDPLSKREKQILVLSQEGLSNKKISDKLSLTVKAVEKIKTSLFEELGLDEVLNLNSFLKKLQYANNRTLIFQYPTVESKKRKIIPPPK